MKLGEACTRRRARLATSGDGRRSRGPAAAEQAGGDDVVDADFTEVKDDDKKSA